MAGRLVGELADQFFGEWIPGSNRLDGWMADCMDGMFIRRKLFG